MVSVTLTDQANCLQDLGRLDEAAEKYEERIKRGEKLEDLRGRAVGKIQLASVRLRQGQYAEALAGYEEARTFFEQQNEPATVATAWHQIGMVHQKAGHYDGAEAAYRHSLEIKAQTNNRAGQATSLNMLGNLYGAHLDRPEEAVSFYWQAAEIYVELEDLRYEGIVRNNIAHTLSKLQRYDEARPEILRAIECKQNLGHVGALWNTFSILSNIETAAGDPTAAQTAWTQARDAYLGYRQQGGTQYNGGKLVNNILELIAQQKNDEIQPLFDQLINDQKTPDSIKQLMQAVVTILNGSRDPALADDPTLDYADAAEILFLIERMGK